MGTAPWPKVVVAAAMAVVAEKGEGKKVVS